MDSKTRQFRMLPHMKSRVADKVKYAATYKIPSYFTVPDENGLPKTYAYSPVMKSIDTDTWGDRLTDITQRNGRPRLEKPEFVNGNIFCRPQENLKADYLWKSPLCVNGPNADPSRAVYMEVRREDEAKNRRKSRKIISQVENAIFNLEEDMLVSYCTINGIKTRDGDGYRLSKELLQDNLITALEINSDGGSNLQPYEDFADDMESTQSAIKLLIGEGLSKNKLFLDRANNAIGFEGSAASFRAPAGTDIFTEMVTWINSDKNGQAFYAQLNRRLNKQEPEPVPEINLQEDATEFDEMAPVEVVNIAKELKAFTYKMKKGYYQKDGSDKLVQTEDGFAPKSYQELSEAYSSSPQVKKDVVYAINFAKENAE